MIEYLQAHTDIFKERRKVLLTSAMDRLGMAQALYKAGCDVTLGDFLFVLNWPLPLKTLKSLALAARMIGRSLVRLPFSMLPTGERQGKQTAAGKYFLENDIIAGDFHFIRQYMPLDSPARSLLPIPSPRMISGF